MSSRVRVRPGPVTIGGWKGTLDIDGAVVNVVGDAPDKRLVIDTREVKRASINRKNGLWALRMKSGEKHYLQGSGLILSTDRSAAGRAANEEIMRLIRAGGARVLTVG